MRITRLASIAGGTALALLLAACGTPQPVAQTAPTMAPERWEYGQVTKIESIASVQPGAMIGTVNPGTMAMGAPATPVTPAATQVARSAAPLPLPHPQYRVTVQTQSGAVRYYDVAATNDLKVGDRVQLQNDVIYR